MDGDDTLGRIAPGPGGPRPGPDLEPEVDLEPDPEPEVDLVGRLAGGLTPETVSAYAHFAIRTRSPLARQVLSAAGAEAEAARVTSLTGAPEAHAAGLNLLDRVISREGVAAQSAEIATLYAQLLVRAERDEELDALLRDPEVPLNELDRWCLRTDLLNPHRVRSGRPPLAGQLAADELAAAERRWLTVLNEIHEPDGLDPVSLRPPGAGVTPYQRLGTAHALELTEAQDRSVDGELVSVVMSAFRPDQDLLLAARGVLEQTWRNLELLIVDDASPVGSEALLEQAQALDPRVRVLRAPRNGGTYQARNLALAVAEGRWMTFQDSDDWTHPRRVELQVRHLLGHPEVLANRTWTLRAYPDLTLTYVGYPPARLNASSLLFDRVPVQQLVGGFDTVRKSADMELPFRLRALRRSSVRDLRHPSPLAITQLRPNSLSRADAIPGWMRWDRLAYRDAYLEWHQQVSARRHSARLPADGRPFPLPRRSWAPDRPPVEEPPRWQVVVLGDLRTGQPRTPRTLGVARAAADAGLAVAVAHAESPSPLAPKRESLSRSLSRDVRLGRVALTNPHEADHADLLVVTEPESLLHLDDASLQVAEILVVADETDPLGWTVAAVEQRCADLFGTLPRWGGPAVLHGGPEPSATRTSVPQERWLDADLTLVAGADWPRVRRLAPGPASREALTGHAESPQPTRPLVIGHHLRDYVSRWPRSPKTMRHAYPGKVWRQRPEEVPSSTAPPPAPPPTEEGPGREARDVEVRDVEVRDVEVHALGGLAVPTAVLRRELPPPSWCSFEDTGMSTREFLAHLDVWVYHGRWDLHAELAALEALAAGLPCVLPAAASASGLEGPVRCVEPWLTVQALAELLCADGNAPRADGEAATADGNAPRTDGEASQADGNAPRAGGDAPTADGVATPPERPAGPHPTHPRHPTHSARLRQDTWAAALRSLVPARDLTPDAPAALLRRAVSAAVRSADHARTAELLAALLDRGEARSEELITLCAAARHLEDDPLLDRAQSALLGRTPDTSSQVGRVLPALAGLRPARLVALRSWRDRLAAQTPSHELTAVDALVLDVQVAAALEAGLDETTVAAVLEHPEGPTRLVRRMTGARRFDDLEALLSTWPDAQLDRVSTMAWHWLRRHSTTHGWTGLAALAATREDGATPTEATRRLVAEAQDEHSILTHPWEPPSPTSARDAGTPNPRSDAEASNPRSVVSVLGQSLPLRSGGYATRSHGILTSLADRGWEVTAVTRLGFPFDLWWGADDEREPARVEVVDGIPYHRLLTDGVRHYPRVPLPPYVAEGAERIAALARERRAALVHASSLYDVGMAGLTAARQVGVPFVYEMRGLKQLLEEARFPLFSGSPRRRYLDQLEGTVAREADALLVITEALGRQMVQMGVDPDRITVVPNGVDAARFTPRDRDEELAERLGLSGRTVIGYLGGLVHYEGLDLLCEAVDLMRRQRDDFHVLVVGDGAYERRLHQVVAELGLGDLITFTGRVPHEQVEDYLSLVDITPFPRKPLPVCEMISPIKPFEAMAMRKAVVASDVAALTEIVQDGVTGRLFAKGDAADLARVLGELLDDPSARARLGAAAREWVVAERDWRRITDTVDGVYRRLLGTDAAG